MSALAGYESIYRWRSLQHATHDFLATAHLSNHDRAIKKGGLGKVSPAKNCMTLLPALLTQWQHHILPKQQPR